MLTARVLGILTTLLLILGLGTSPAAAAAGTQCEVVDRGGRCLVWAKQPPKEKAKAKPAARNHPAGNSPRKATCTFNGQAVDCQSDAGTWSNARQCWVALADPQPPKDDHVWEGQPDGAIYECVSPMRSGSPRFGVPLPVVSVFWSPDAPPRVNPSQLAAEAVDSMDLRAIDIGLTPPPDPDSRTLLGIPTWMWVDDPGPQTWGSITRSASAGGVTVTATGRVRRVVWDMGDGASVTCGQGTAYQVGFDDAPSPDCGHLYSAPGTYTVTGTSFWEVDWSGGGQSGTIEFTLSRETTVRVAEAFALVQGQG